MKPPRQPYKFHPACLAFPLLPDAELRELADDIKLRGLLHPVVLYQGQVLDGRNRLAACEIAGVAPLTPGGLCLAYAGQMYLPQVLAAMGRYLRYWWTFGIFYDPTGYLS
jgi:hypothetical protein